MELVPGSATQPVYKPIKKGCGVPLNTTCYFGVTETDESKKTKTAKLKNTQAK